MPTATGPPSPQSLLVGLPVEVLDEIMALLDQKDLQAVSKTCKGLHAVATKQLYKRPDVTTAEGLIHFANTVDLNTHLASLVVDLRDVTTSEMEVEYDTLTYVVRQIYRVCRNVKWLSRKCSVDGDSLPYVTELYRLDDLKLYGRMVIALPKPNTWLYLTCLDIFAMNPRQSFAVLARACPRVTRVRLDECQMSTADLFDALSTWTCLRSLEIANCDVEFAPRGPDLKVLQRLFIGGTCVAGMGQFFARCPLQELHLDSKREDTIEPFDELRLLNTSRLVSLSISSSTTPVSVPHILRQYPSLRELSLAELELDTAPVGHVAPHGLKKLCISLGDAAIESALFVQLRGLMPGLESCTILSGRTVLPVVDTRPFLSTTTRLTSLSIIIHPNSLLFGGLPSTLQRLTVGVTRTSPCWTFADARQLSVRCPRLSNLKLYHFAFPSHLVLLLVCGLRSLKELLVYNPATPLSTQELRVITGMCPGIKMNKTLHPPEISALSAARLLSDEDYCRTQ